MYAYETSALAGSKSDEALKTYERIDKDIRRAAERGEHYLTYIQALIATCL